MKTGTWAEPHSKSLASPFPGGHATGIVSQKPGDPETGKALFQRRTTETPHKHRRPSKSGSWHHRETRSSHTVSSGSALKTEVTPRRNGWKPSKRARPVSSRRRGEKPSHNTAVQSARPATCCKDRGPGTARGAPRAESGRQGLVSKPARGQGVGLRKRWLLGEHPQRSQAPPTGPSAAFPWAGRGAKAQSWMLCFTEAGP